MSKYGEIVRTLNTDGLLTCVGVTTTGDLTSTGAAIDWDLIDNNASALSIDTGTLSMLEFNTTNDAEQLNMLRGLQVKRFHAIVTLATDGAETAVGLTPSAVILSAAIRVSTQITGLDSATHTINLGINGAATKYIAVSQGAIATTIDVNKKGHYTFDPTTDTEAAAVVLTIAGDGADNTPTGGAVEVEIIYLVGADLASV
jgi:hypothetical protein